MIQGVNNFVADAAYLRSRQGEGPQDGFRQQLDEMKSARSAQAAVLSEGIDPSGSDNSFAASVKATLTPDAQGNIHEEELQHAVVSYLLNEMSPEAKQAYQLAVDSYIGSGQPPRSAEDAVKLALREVVAAGLVSEEEARNINGISFRAAQLDSDMTALFDNRGSGQDPTIAVMSIDAAIAKAEAALQGISSGEIQVSARALNAPSNVAPSAAVHGIHGSAGGSGAGFLWKPVSERDGKLVVLLPSSLTGSVQSAGIYSSLPPSNSTLIERGDFAGDTHNGGRAHFRFDKPGGGYPDGVYVVAQLTNGETKVFQIGNSSSRNS